MTHLLLACALLAVLAAIVVVGAVRRNRRGQQSLDAMRRRLDATYGVAERVPETMPLESPPGPPGQVAIEGEGLYLHLGGPPAPLDLRLVPWSRVQHVTPASGGRFVVHVSRVGTVVVPSALGRRIWDAVGAARAEREAEGPGAERGRPTRV